MRQAESLAARIREDLGSLFHSTQLTEVITSASLAHQGLLGRVPALWLSDVDLASVPAEHLASLASCVESNVGISNVCHTDLSSVLNSVNSDQLSIHSQTLSSEETRALVMAMETGVERLRLGCSGDVSLDIRALTRYSGQGRCQNLMIWDSGDRYLEEVRSWAQRRDWDITHDNYRDFVVIERKL